MKCLAGDQDYMPQRVVPFLYCEQFLSFDILHILLISSIRLWHHEKKKKIILVRYQDQVIPLCFNFKQFLFL